MGSPTLFYTIGDYLNILSNDTIKDLSGFGSLISIGSDLNIESNGISLSNLDGFESLIQVNGGINIESNFGLQNIDGLSSVRFAGDYVAVLNNLLLTDVNGLSGLASVPSALASSTNPSLTDITTLLGLITVGQKDNPYEANIKNRLARGLDRSTNSPSGLMSKDNEKLSVGEVSLLLGAQGPPHDLVDGIIDIESNTSGCSSIDEVLEFSNYVERQNFNHASTCKLKLL